MTACKIESRVVNMDHNGNFNQQATTQSQCMTHRWLFQHGMPLGVSCMCPIGRIEYATDFAIERIRQEMIKQRDTP